jgi:hypothetical protein
MVPPSRFVQIFLLALLVLGGGWFWWTLRSERLAAPPKNPPGEVAQPQPRTLKPITLDTLTFQVQPSELETSSENYPDHDLLGNKCQPAKNLFSYTSIDMAQSESIFTWDASKLTTQNHAKQERFTSLEDSLDALLAQADPRSHRLPLQGEWDAQAVFPWNDPDCGGGEMNFYPLYIEEVDLPRFEKAWYMESLEGSGIPDLPVMRRLFLLSGNRWIVVSEQQSAEKELQLSADDIFATLETECDSLNAKLPDIITCEAALWFAQHRKPEFHQAWIGDVASRISLE